MLNHGIPVLIVSKRLGHSKPSITMDVYGHLIPSQQEEAAELMDDLLFDSITPVAPGLHPTLKGAKNKTPDMVHLRSLAEKIPYIGSLPRT